MVNLLFTEPPSVELLQWLARGSLKQLLPRAIRLWVELRFLYSETATLPDPFTYANWRNTFFTATHPTGETIPPAHDPQCRCAQTGADWLFAPNTGVTCTVWSKSLKQHASCPDHLDEILASPLFRVTRRTLAEDLQILYKLGWLKRKGQAYSRVQQFPDRPQPAQSSTNTSIIMHPDLAAIAENLSHQINGCQRFFLHVEYVVPRNAIDQVDDWQVQLRQIWEQTPIPPIHLSYYSAQFNRLRQGIVYPVCIYYVQRATYLCAWGQTPDGSPEKMDWRNYRLDRIHHLTPLSWNDKRIPDPLRHAYRQQKLPTPDYIQERMAEAWGFDFYKPNALMVLRFDRQFSDGYVRGTVRHDTFEPINYEQVEQLIRQSTRNKTHQKNLRNLWQSRSPQDAYYKACYRDGDPNVMLRLRAWRPNMEVLLPWHLRQQIIQEIEQELHQYQPPS